MKATATHVHLNGVKPVVGEFYSVDIGTPPKMLTCTINQKGLLVTVPEGRPLRTETVKDVKPLDGGGRK